MQKNIKLRCSSWWVIRCESFVGKSTKREGFSVCVLVAMKICMNAHKEDIHNLIQDCSKAEIWIQWIALETEYTNTCILCDLCLILLIIGIIKISKFKIVSYKFEFSFNLNSLEWVNRYLIYVISILINMFFYIYNLFFDDCSCRKMILYQWKRIYFKTFSDLDFDMRIWLFIKLKNEISFDVHSYLPIIISFSF